MWHEQVDTEVKNELACQKKKNKKKWMCKIMKIKQNWVL